MRITKGILVSLVVLVGLQACGHRQSDEAGKEVVRVEMPDFKGETLSMDEMVAGCKVLPLHTDTAEYVAQIQDLCMLDSSFYILDASTASLSRFNSRSGVLERHIQARGNGPFEYIHPTCITARDTSVYVLDLPTQKIIKYDTCLVAKKEIRVSYPLYDLIKTDKGFLGYNLAASDSVGKIVYLDNEGKLLDSFVAPEHERPTYMASIFTKGKDGRIYVLPSHNQTVYGWDESAETLQPSFYLDFGEHNMPTGTDPSRTDLADENVVEMCEFFNLDSVMVGSFLHKNVRYYSKLSSATLAGSSGKMTVQTGGLPFYPRWQAGNMLIGTCEYGLVADYMEQAKGKQEEHYGDVLLLFNL